MRFTSASRATWTVGVLLGVALAARPARARPDTFDLFAQAGWDTPGLLGVGAAWRVRPSIELDGSLDLATGGPALSLDGRWFFRDDGSGFFVGLGLVDTGGGDVFECHRAFDETHCSDTVEYRVGSSLALPAFVGWRTPDLWRLWAAVRVGWSFLLDGGELEAGTQTPDAIDRAASVPAGFVLAVEAGFRLR